MNIRHLHHIRTQVKKLSPVVFLVPAVLLMLLAIYGLRQNNFKMIELRQAVIAADEQNGDVETALQELRTHVHSHMNTNLSSGATAIDKPIQLKARYERLVQNDASRVKAANDKVAADGDAVCARQFPAGGFNADRVSCIQSYVSANAAQTNAVAEDLYKFDFVSPRWSPDLAGMSIVLGCIFFLLFIARLLFVRFIQ